ncbi:hypothetical protein ACTXT7_011375 [Hymenolepis weldensis]
MKVGLANSNHIFFQWLRRQNGLTWCSSAFYLNIAEVLQCRIEHRFLIMYPDPKCIGPPIARIEVHCLSTVPWERDPLSSSHKDPFGPLNFSILTEIKGFYESLMVIPKRNLTAVE